MPPDEATCDKATPTFETKIGSRSNNFDVLRLALAIVVMYSHCFPLLYGPQCLDQVNRLTHGQMRDSGEVAVRFFFVISGFLITASWQRSKGAGDYLKKRVLRICPGLLVALLFCIVVVGPLSGVKLGAYFSNLETYRFMRTGLMAQIKPGLPGVFEHSPFPGVVNGSTWSIKYEFICYLLVMVFGWMALLRFRAGFLTVFAVSLMASKLNLVTHIWMPWVGDLSLLPTLLSYFMAGAIVHLYRERIPYSPVWFGVSLLALAVTLKSHFWLTLPIFGTYALFYLAYLPSRFQHIGRKRDLSYGIYLYAFPITQLLVQYFGPHLNPYKLFALTLPLSVGMAFLSWHFVEHPFLKRKSSRAAGVEVRTVHSGESALPVHSGA